MFDFNLPVAHIPDNYREFLPTMTTPAVDELLYAYEQGEDGMRRLHADLMSKENRSVLEAFAYGAEAYQTTSKKSFWAREFIELFDLNRAINARQEHFWFRLFDLCSLTNILPQELWDKWSGSFTAWRSISKGGERIVAGIPPFDRSTVYGSLSLIESHRANFFSMRVDALWKGLSPSHKTNWGGAFHKRFILDWMYNDHGSTTQKDRVFHDLINVCSTIMTGAEDPFTSAYAELRYARERHGEWVEVMGGVIRIKAFLKGTLHVEIHPEIAFRMNIALAYIHPNALPDEATLKPPRRKSGFGSAELLKSPVQPQVRSYLRSCTQQQQPDGLWMLKCTGASHYIGTLSGGIKSMIDVVLEQIGGVRHSDVHLFDYPPQEVVSEIVNSGKVPDKVSHQFYSTPAELAKEFIEWVGVDELSICYETSAGTGSIAKHMPLQTYCVEVDRLRALALDKMGFEVKQADFLRLAPGDLHGAVDAVLMNPPYAGRAWQDHMEHAVQFVRNGGVIGAILPEGARRKMPSIQGVEVIYSEPKNNRFPDTTISVVFAKWQKTREAAEKGSMAGVADRVQQDLFAAA